MMKLLQVSALAAALFGLEDVSDIKELDSYDDRNFYIRARNPRLSEGDDLVHGARFHTLRPLCSTNSSHPDPVCFSQTAEYVLKVHNGVDSQKSDFLHAQNEALLFLNAHGTKCPMPQKGLSGRLRSPSSSNPSSTYRNIIPR